MSGIVNFFQTFNPDNIDGDEVQASVDSPAQHRRPLLQYPGHDADQGVCLTAPQPRLTNHGRGGQAICPAVSTVGGPSSIRSTAATPLTPQQLKDRFDDGLDYISAVQRKFGDRSKIYQQFLTLMKARNNCNILYIVY